MAQNAGTAGQRHRRKTEKIICVDGKTMHANKREGTWPDRDKGILSNRKDKLDVLEETVESMHWHLDVTFKEGANTTLDKTAAQNQNIIRKWCLSMLKQKYGG